MAEGTGGRRHLAVRTRAPAAAPALSAAETQGDHARVSRPNDPGFEALEIRHRLDGRGLPKGGHAGGAPTVCLPDLRWRLQGPDHIGLSGTLETCCAVRRLRADGVSGRPRRAVAASARGSDRA